MKRKIIRISCLLIMDHLKSEFIGCYKRISDQLPADTTIVGCFYDYKGFIDLCVESEEFESVREGDMFPVFEVTYELK